MNKSRHTLKFIGIIFLLIVITIITITINYEFFLDVDYRRNGEIAVAMADTPNVFAKEDGREYKIIYNKNEQYSINLKDNFQRVFEATKAEYTVYETADDVSFDKDDFIILTIVGWSEYQPMIEEIFTSVNEGAELFVGFIPVFDDYFMTKTSILGITGVKERVQTEYADGFVIVDDVLLGMKHAESLIDPALDDVVYEIYLHESTHLFLQTENRVPLYFTNKYGDGNIGVYNGENITERYMDGLLVGILGTMGEDYIYPIVNAGLMFIDDWPGPFRGYNEIIEEQYDMNVDDFMRYVWWPDMLSLAKQNNVKYVGQYVLTYTDNKQEPYINSEVNFDTNMYAFGQQVVKYGGELGLHGYNHEPLYYNDYPADTPLHYTKWDSYQGSVDALNAALGEFEEYFPDYNINCYVPPSNIISDEGIRAVKEVLGEPVIIAGMYTEDKECYVEAHDLKYEDGVVYMPRFSSGCIADDMTLSNIALSVSMYGMVSHFIHPDDVMDKRRNKGKTWEEMRAEYAKLMGFINERYPFLQYETATESANKLIDWYNQDYYIDYQDDYIHIKTKNESEYTAMILRTEKQVLKSDDYDIVQCGDLSYYIKLHGSDVKILLKGQDE